MRRAARGILSQTHGLELLVLEGGGPLEEIWAREAARLGIASRRLSAEQWRAVILGESSSPMDRDRAKHAADRLARKVIAWSGARRPVSLRHDAAEAILIGLWACLEVGWLDQMPPALRS